MWKLASHFPHQGKVAWINAEKIFAKNLVEVWGPLTLDDAYGVKREIVF